MTRFADQTENAEWLEQSERDYMIKKAQEAAQAVPVNDSGRCWQCDVKVPDTRRWCSFDCMSAYTKKSR